MADKEPKKKMPAADKDGGGQAKEHKKPWQETTATVAEIRDYLSNNVYLRYNLVTRQVECRRPEPDFFSARGRPPSPLDSLPPWDRNTNPILALSASVGVKGDADEQLFFYECLQKWLVGMVAGWIDEGGPCLHGPGLPAAPPQVGPRLLGRPAECRGDQGLEADDDGG